jgi:hypothetical protein
MALPLIVGGVILAVAIIGVAAAKLRQFLADRYAIRIPFAP